MRKAQPEADPESESSLSLKAGDTSKSCSEEAGDPQVIRCEPLETRGQASGGRPDDPLVRQAEAEAHPNIPNAQHVTALNSATSRQTSATNEGVVMPVTVGIETLGAPDNGMTGQSSSSRSSSPQRWFERVFFMIIHGREQNEQRLTCLDTCADIDAISYQVVKEMKLWGQLEEYTGGVIKPLGGSYKPKYQITLNWHVLNFPKTYTNTFIVFDEQYSKDFDVLLGRYTIRKIGFYQKAPNVWFSATEGDVPVSQAIINPAINHQHLN
ncbi:MAG: hypothetical protein Q9198_003167 [Flavoplaca austrocitrina]